MLPKMTLPVLHLRKTLTSSLLRSAYVYSTLDTELMTYILCNRIGTRAAAKKNNFTHMKNDKLFFFEYKNVLYNIRVCLATIYFFIVS